MKHQININLTNFNTFHLSSFAKNYLELTNIDQLANLDEEVFVLGGGSNVILPENMTKMVLKNSIKGINIIDENSESVLIKVGAGENWHEFVEFSVNCGYYGLENLALIPGTVGAAPIQNIGAYGVEQSSTFQSLEYYHLEKKEIIKIHNFECKFAYRDSVFKKDLKSKAIILNVTYKLSKKINVNIGYKDFEKFFLNKKSISSKNVFDAVVSIRNSKLPNPSEIPNCGSFFKNPIVESVHFENLKKEYSKIKYYEVNDKYKIPAAWLIENCGLKGFRINDVQVSKNHALVLINTGKAAYNDVIDLKNYIIKEVFKKFNIKLEVEVNIIQP
ncbi:UDP-N-acetylmuramate dehydrogenase [Candidatus Kapabacteria bacterium]|nr:UDP-N-acetylmuramate dehydrogenase [Candidatus Kapabacteria bacterium]